jgi:hypothetical protein
MLHFHTADKELLHRLNVHTLSMEEDILEQQKIENMLNKFGSLILGMPKEDLMKVKKLVELEGESNVEIRPFCNYMIKAINHRLYILENK